MQPVSSKLTTYSVQPNSYPFPRETFGVSTKSDLETTEKFGHPEWWLLTFENKNQNGHLAEIIFSFFVDDKSVRREKPAEIIFVCLFKPKLKSELDTFAYFLKKSGFEFTLESEEGMIETPDIETIKKLLELFCSNNSIDENGKKIIDSALLEIDNALKGSYSRNIAMRDCVRGKA